MQTWPYYTVPDHHSTHVRVIRHFLEKVVVLAVMQQPIFAFGLFNKGNVGHVKIINTPDNENGNPRNRHYRACVSRYGENFIHDVHYAGAVCVRSLRLS